MVFMVIGGPLTYRTKTLLENIGFELIDAYIASVVTTPSSPIPHLTLIPHIYGGPSRLRSDSHCVQNSCATYQHSKPIKLSKLKNPL